MRTFRTKRDINGKWRRFHNEELHSLCGSPNIVTVMMSSGMRWAGHVVRMEEGTSSFKILTLIPTGRSRRRWEDRIRMDSKKHRYQYEKLG